MLFYRWTLKSLGYEVGADAAFINTPLIIPRINFHFAYTNSIRITSCTQVALCSPGTFTFRRGDHDIDTDSFILKEDFLKIVFGHLEKISATQYYMGYDWSKKWDE